MYSSSLSLLSVIVVIVEMTALMDNISNQEESHLIAKSNKRTFSLRVKWKKAIKLLPLRRKNSLAVLFICKKRSGLEKLGKLYVSGELRCVLQKRFTSWLLTDYPQATVHIKELVWELSDYCRCSLYFNPVLQRELYHDHIS